MPPYKPTSDLAKKAWRQGVNPAQVLGRAGHPNGGKGLRLNLAKVGGDKWYLPHSPTWALLDTYDECAVIAKAVIAYGFVQTQDKSDAMRALIVRIRSDVAALRPLDVEQAVEDANGYVALPIAAEHYPAAPLCYVLRRYAGYDVAWWQHDDTLILEARVDDVAVAYVTRWQWAEQLAANVDAPPPSLPADVDDVSAEAS